jgi:hypothetical protein
MTWRAVRLPIGSPGEARWRWAPRRTCSRPARLGAAPAPAGAVGTAYASSWYKKAPGQTYSSHHIHSATHVSRQQSTIPSYLGRGAGGQARGALRDACRGLRRIETGTHGSQRRTKIMHSKHASTLCACTFLSGIPVIPPSLPRQGSSRVHGTLGRAPRLENLQGACG